MTISFMQHIDLATQIFFLAPLVLIALDILSGILLALKQKVFTIGWLGAFAQSAVVPYIGLLLTFLVMPMAAGVPYLVAADAAKISFGLFCLSQLRSVERNIAVLFGKQPFLNTVDDAINALMGKIFPFVPVTKSVDTAVTETVPASPATDSAPTNGAA